MCMCMYVDNNLLHVLFTVNKLFYEIISSMQVSLSSMLLIDNNN